MSLESRRLSRRDFLKSSAALGSLSVLPSYVALGQSAGGVLPPSERVNLAVVGIGNQGRNDLLAMVRSGHCNVVALCDVDLEGGHTRDTLREFGGRSAAEPVEGSPAAPPNAPRARTFNDFRRMFDAMGDEIDAVLIATPDHSHFCVAMLAMSLGKHVYVEKPLAHTFGQTERLIRMEARTKVVTQMGNQGHSGANYFQFKAWSEAGLIKDVTRITAHMNEARRWHGWGAQVSEYPSDPLPPGLDWDQWIDSAPEHPFSRRLHPCEWRSWFDYGSGAFGDWGPHILDTCHRFLELGLPERVLAVDREGANPLVYPQASTIRFGFPRRGDKPPCEVTWYDGVDNIPEVEREYGDLASDSGRTRRPVELRNPGKVIYGGDGLVFQGGSHGSALRIIPRDRMLEMRESLPEFPQRNSDHYANFLLACKGEETARSPFSVSGPLTQVFNLGVIAQRLGGDLRFDPARKQFTNSSEGNRLLDPPPRDGWEGFYSLWEAV